MNSIAGLTMLPLIFLASLSFAAPHPSPSKPIASFLPPTISFQRRWKTKLQVSNLDMVTHFHFPKLRNGIKMLKIAKSTILSWLELPNGLQFSVIGSSKWNNFCAEWSRGRISSKSKNTLCISPNVSRWATMLSSLTWLGITRGNGRAGTTGLMRWSPTQRTF